MGSVRREQIIFIYHIPSNIYELSFEGAENRTVNCEFGYFRFVDTLHEINYMDKDLLLVAKDDELGRKLQDLDLPVRKRVSKKG